MTTEQDITITDPTELYMTTTPTRQTTGSGMTSSDVGFYFRCAVVVIGVVGTAANGVVLYALIASKQHKKHLLIVNQNLVDLVSCFFLSLSYGIRLYNIHLDADRAQCDERRSLLGERYRRMNSINKNQKKISRFWTEWTCTVKDWTGMTFGQGLRNQQLTESRGEQPSTMQPTVGSKTPRGKAGKGSMHLDGVRGYWLCMTLLSEGPPWGPFLASLINLAAITVERYQS